MRFAHTSLLALSLIFIASFAANAEMLAAAGKVEITPTKPVWMAGYGPNRRSEGAHDPLCARCLVLKNGAEEVALVSCDCIGLSRFHVLKMRSMIKSMPGDHVLIGATHTHSGPDTYGQWGPSPEVSGLDKAWMADTYSKVAKLVDETAGKLQPATLRFGNTTDVKRCSKNIRIPRVLDTELGALQVLDKSGATIATLINYACHPEILDNHQLTSDFPNWLRNTVEAKLGGVAIYMNGAQGGMVTADVEVEKANPKGEDWPDAERIGNTLGEKAIECLASPAAVNVDDAKIGLTSRTIRVPLQNKRFEALIQAKILPNFLVNGNVVTEVNRLTVGPAEFLTLPGEVLPNVGLFLKRKMTGQPRFLLGLTCDALGYIMDKEDYGLQLYSYETATCIGPTMGSTMTDNLLALIAAGKPQ